VPPIATLHIKDSNKMIQNVGTVEQAAAKEGNEREISMQ
jgi:hypothetical protein